MHPHWNDFLFTFLTMTKIIFWLRLYFLNNNLSCSYCLCFNGLKETINFLSASNRPITGCNMLVSLSLISKIVEFDFGNWIWAWWMNCGWREGFLGYEQTKCAERCVIYFSSYYWLSYQLLSILLTNQT